MCIYDCMWNPTVRLIINRFLSYIIYTSYQIRPQFAVISDYRYETAYSSDNGDLVLLIIIKNYINRPNGKRDSIFYSFFVVGPNLRV